MDILEKYQNEYYKLTPKKDFAQYVEKLEANREKSKKEKEFKELISQTTTKHAEKNVIPVTDVKIKVDLILIPLRN